MTSQSEKSGAAGPREQTTEPARDKIAAVIDEHTATGCEGVGLLNCWCGERFDTWAEHSLHAADAVVEALTDAGWTLMRPVTAEEEAKNVW